jgi:hypothetical protein
MTVVQAKEIRGTHDKAGRGSWKTLLTTRRAALHACWCLLEEERLFHQNPETVIAELLKKNPDSVAIPMRSRCDPGDFLIPAIPTASSAVADCCRP